MEAVSSSVAHCLRQTKKKHSKGEHIQGNIDRALGQTSMTEQLDRAYTGSEYELGGRKKVPCETDFL